MTSGVHNYVLLRVCLQCGKGFMAYRDTARTCSGSCRNLLSRERRQREHAERVAQQVRLLPQELRQ